MTRNPLRLCLAFLAAMLPLAACVSTHQDLATQKIAVSEECVIGKCRFNNAPVKLAPEKIKLEGRAYDFRRLAARLDFIDAGGLDWQAPEKSLTDGASIPEIFVPLIGFPNEPKFANASALHDAYCGVGNETVAVYHSRTWQEVHRLFYDALVASGTPDVKAKIMFAAVWLGGPRWNTQGVPDTALDGVPDAEKEGAMVEAMAFIEHEKPDMKELVEFLDEQVKEMLRKKRYHGERAPSRQAANDLANPL